MSKPVLLLIGGHEMHYYATQLKEDFGPRFDVLELKARQAFDFVTQSGALVACVITPLYHSILSGMNVKETDNGINAGVVALNRVKHYCPQAKLFLMDGGQQNLLKEDGQVIFLDNLARCLPSNLSELLGPYLKSH